MAQLINFGGDVIRINSLKTLSSVQQMVVARGPLVVAMLR